MVELALVFVWPWVVKNAVGFTVNNLLERQIAYLKIFAIAHPRDTTFVVELKSEGKLSAQIYRSQKRWVNKIISGAMDRAYDMATTGTPSFFT